VTVDLARDLAETLGVPLRLACFDAARDSFTAVRDGEADLCFLAIEPAREGDIAFTAPYALIEGVYATAGDTALRTADDVDRPGIRVGVKRGSAYDLYLTRTLLHATIERGIDGTTVTEELGLEVAAGIRTPVTDWAAARTGWRVLEPSFMQIQQALGVPKHRNDTTIAFLRDHVEARKADGFVADSLARSGRTDAQVAPPGR
jgi:polar amino acid transport system substrate-binding protein